MRSFKKVVLGVKLDEDCDIANLLTPIDFLRSSDVYLIHVSRLTDHKLFPELKLALYPSGEEKIILEQAVIDKLNQIKLMMLTSGWSGEIEVKCIFSEDPKKKFSHFASEINSDLIIVIAEKRKILIGSFVRYQVEHSKIPVFILKS